MTNTLLTIFKTIGYHTLVFLILAKMTKIKDGDNNKVYFI